MRPDIFVSAVLQVMQEKRGHGCKGELMEKLNWMMEEVARRLEEERQNHDVARLVVPEECREIRVCGEEFFYGRPCFDIWGATSRCSNCSSYKARYTGKRIRKSERMGELVCHVESVPLVISCAGRVLDSLVLERVDYRLATDTEKENIPDKRQEQHLSLAYYDALTGLFTRQGFFIHTRNLLEKFRSQGEDFVLIQMNVCHFRIINNLYGIEKGNRLVVLMADRIRAIQPKNSIAGRTGADVFVVVMPRKDFKAENWEHMLWRVEQMAGEDVFHVHIRAGVFLGDSVNVPISRMIEYTWAAQETIANDLTSHIAYYRPGQMQKARRTQRMINLFEKAIRQEEFQVYLQPQVDRHGKVVSAEVLSRWVTTSGEVISPGDFIPALELTGQIVRLDHYVWGKAIQLLKKWEGTPFENLKLSLNIFPEDFDYLDVPDTLCSLADMYGVPREKINVEITESAIISPSALRQRVADRLVDAGFGLEIDDFGKGNSSLNTLRNIKAQTLKLDMDFLKISEDSSMRGMIIIESMIHMAKLLDMTVVAEGVEVPAQRDALLEMDCDLLQGFLFSRPVPVAEFEKTFEKNLA